MGRFRVARVTRRCEHCGTEFQPLPQQVKRGTGKYCSRKCASPNMFGTVTKRFWRKVQKTDACWLWTGRTNRNGYGSVTATVSYQRVPAHRLSWELHFGPIPEGMVICHKCDNPPCVNPSHLFLGTHADNMRDMLNKERESRGTKHPCAKLTEDDVREIRQRYADGEILQPEIAAKYGLGRSTVSQIISRKRWKHVP